MSKKIIPFPLVMKNGAKVKTVEELRANADIESIMSHYIKGSLSRWCTAFHYDDIIAATDNITEQIVRKLYEVLQIDVNEDELKQYLKNKTIIADDGDDEIQEDEKIEEVKNEQKETKEQKAPASSIKDFVFVDVNEYMPAFYICDHPVTQAEYQAIMGKNPSYFKGFVNNPVEEVSWYDAVEYCNKRSEKEGLTPYYDINKKRKDSNNTNNYDDKKWIITPNESANGYRLPTEEEWAVAASGGKLSEGFKYSGSNNIDDVAWYVGNSDWKTHPVKKKNPNELGIYDMSGNVSEWCWDYYDGGNRVYRSGSWSDAEVDCEVSYRYRINPSITGNDLGFRVVRSV